MTLARICLAAGGVDAEEGRCRLRRRVPADVGRCLVVVVVRVGKEAQEVEVVVVMVLVASRSRSILQMMVAWEGSLVMVNPSDSAHSATSSC